MPEPRKLRVFLCHSSNDKPAVRELYKRLNAEGWIDPWLDEENLYPGQEWDLEIEKAVEQTDVVLVSLSTRSVDKEGYIQKELRFVLNIAETKPEGAIFIVPLRLGIATVHLAEKKARREEEEREKRERERAAKVISDQIKPESEEIEKPVEKKMPSVTPVGRASSPTSLEAPASTVCMTWRAMSGSGWQIGMKKPITRIRATPPILWGRIRVLPGCCEAARGIAAVASSVLPSAIGTFQRLLATRSVFVTLFPMLNKLYPSPHSLIR